MLRTPIIGAVSGVAITLSAAAFAQQGGTAEDARAMLDKAVAAVKTDQAVALAMFLKGEGGFLDRDLYPFCFRIADGKTLASPKAVPAGTDVRSLKDASGNAYGLAIYAAGQKPEGQVTELQSYMFPKPGTTAPTFPKVSFVTRAGELEHVVFDRNLDSQRLRFLIQRSCWGTEASMDDPALFRGYPRARSGTC